MNAGKGFFLAAVAFVFVLTVSISAAPIELVWSSWDGGDVGASHQAAVDEWNRLNPDIHVTYQSWSGYYEKVKTTLAAGTGPDLMQLDAFAVAELAASGSLLDLTEWMKRDSIVQDYFPPAIEALSHDGRIMAVPREGGPNVMWINRDLFVNGGVTLPTENWTYDDYERAARKLTFDQADGTVAQYGANIRLAWDDVVQSDGNYYFDLENNKGNFSNEGVVHTLQWISDMINVYGASMPLGVGGYGFTTGKLALTSGPRANYKWLQGAAQFDWTFELLPKGKGGRVPHLYMTSVALNSATQHPEEAYAFVKWLLGKEGWDARLQTGKQVGVPLNQRAIMNEYFLNSGAPQVSREVNMRIAMAVTTALPNPSIPEWSQISSEAVSPNLSALWRGEVPARIAAENIDAAIDAILSDK